MKYFFLVILSLFSVVVSAQASLDTVKLSPQELFEFNSRWNLLGTSQTYVDFSKDVLSTSDLSLGVVGRKISTTLNLSYNITSKNGNWNNMFMTSINPSWKYYGFGWGTSRTKYREKFSHNTTLQTNVSSDFDFQKNLTFSLIDIYNTKRFGKFGLTVTASKTFWGEWEGPWEGQYLTDSLGNFVSNIYPINPPSTQLVTRLMLMYSWPIKTKIVDISPQILTTTDIYTVFKSENLEIGYLADFNLDIYWGLAMGWKITKKFVLNTNIRLNSTIDKSSTSSTYKKSNPILFMIGTSFGL